MIERERERGERGSGRANKIQRPESLHCHWVCVSRRQEDRNYLSLLPLFSLTLSTLSALSPEAKEPNLIFMFFFIFPETGPWLGSSCCLSNRKAQKVSEQDVWLTSSLSGALCAQMARLTSDTAGPSALCADFRGKSELFDYFHFHRWPNGNKLNVLFSLHADIILNTCAERCLLCYYCAMTFKATAIYEMHITVFLLFLYILSSRILTFVQVWWSTYCTSVLK